MSESSNPEQTSSGTGLDPEEYGSLTVEDEGAETVDPADVAGTADSDDEEIGYSPNSGADDEQG